MGIYIIDFYYGVSQIKILFTIIIYIIIVMLSTSNAKNK